MIPEENAASFILRSKSESASAADSSCATSYPSGGGAPCDIQQLSTGNNSNNDKKAQSSPQITAASVSWDESIIVFGKHKEQLLLHAE